MRKLGRWTGLGAATIAVAAVAVVVMVAAAFAGPRSHVQANPYKLGDPTKLTVGMNLQYKPQMYLDKKGKPAGYDVVLLKALAKQMKVKLDIKNLDFNGLIPGLVS